MIRFSHWRKLTMAVGLLLWSVGCSNQQRNVPVIQLPSPTNKVIPITHSYHGLLAPCAAGYEIPNGIPTFDAKWSEQGLDLTVRYHDETPNTEAKPADFFKGDSFEIFIARADHPKEFYQVVVASGGSKELPAARYLAYDHRRGAKSPLKFGIQDLPHKSGSEGIHITLPWETLGYKSGEANRVLLQIIVNDMDNYGRLKRFCWYPAVDTFINPLSTYELALSKEKTVERQDFTITAELQQNRRLLVCLYHDPTSVSSALLSVSALFEQPQLPPESVPLSPAYGPIDTTRVRVKNGYARFQLPVQSLNRKPQGLDLSRMKIRVGEANMMESVSRGFSAVYETHVQPTGGDLSKGLKSALNAAFQRVEMRFGGAMGGFNELNGSVFAGEKLPVPAFENPVDVEDLIGIYSIKTDYYDADYQPVTKATKPGRYGAVVTITNGEGETWHRYYTLFKIKGDFKDLRNLKIPVTADLPENLGLDPQVVAEQKALLGESYKSFFTDSIRKDNRVAVMLAALAESKPGDTAGVSRVSAANRDAKWWWPLKQKLGEPIYRHTIIKPAGFDDPKNAGKKWPVIVFLHGSAERGNDLNQVLTSIWALPLYAKQMKDFPAFIVAPQCGNNENWNPPELNTFLDKILAENPIDPDRVYLTGVSMGGFGMWNWYQDSPERFAAVAPVCGGGDKDDVERVKNVPIWIFHGDADYTVPIQGDLECYQALKAVHARVRFTIYPGGGHDASIPTYNNPKFYEWLWEQNRKNPAEPVGGTEGPATQPAKDWQNPKPIK